MWSQQGPLRLTPKYCVSTRAEMAGGGTGRCGQRPVRAGRASPVRARKAGNTPSPVAAPSPSIRPHPYTARTASTQRERPRQRWASDLAFEIIGSVGVQRNGDAIRGDDGFEVRANVAVQRFETFAQVRRDRRAAARADANRAQRYTARLPGAKVRVRVLRDGRAWRSADDATEQVRN